MAGSSSDDIMHQTHPSHDSQDFSNLLFNQLMDPSSSSSSFNFSDPFPNHSTTIPYPSSHFTSSSAQVRTF
jgi:hypothetical protein